MSVSHAQHETAKLDDSMLPRVVMLDPTPPVQLEYLTYLIRKKIHEPTGSVNGGVTNDTVWMLAWQQRRRQYLRPDHSSDILRRGEFFWILFAVHYENRQSDKRYAVGLATGWVPPWSALPIVSDSIGWYWDTIMLLAPASDSAANDAQMGRHQPPSNIKFFESDLLRLSSADVRAFLGRAFGATDTPFDFFSADLCPFYVNGVFEYIRGAIMTNTWRRLFNEQAPEIRAAR